MSMTVVSTVRPNCPNRDRRRARNDVAEIAPTRQIRQFGVDREVSMGSRVREGY